MNALTFFTLGVLSTLFLAKIMYTFIGVLRVQQKVKTLESNLKSFGEHNDKEFEQIRQSADKNFNLLDDRICLDVQHLHQEIDELRKYIDSRIDKSLNHLQK